MPVYEPLNLFSRGVGEPLAVIVAPRLLWLVFALILIFYLVMSWILVYHWNRHGQGKILFVRSAYFLVTTSLLIIMAVSIFLYGSSI